MNEIALSAALSKYGHLYNVKLFEIVEQFGSLEHLYKKWLASQTKDIPARLIDILHKAWSRENLIEINQLISQHTNKAYLFSDSDYPESLKQITDPPYVLFVKGSDTVFQTHILISCVGTRAMTSYGQRAIKSLIAPLSGYPIAIVSGLALGVDAEVHKSALDNNLPTIAVLGGGLDRFEPLSNAAIGQKISQTACVVSEYPPSVRPQKHHFLERNRIIAGLSRATIVIEGKLQSGALVTARYALQYGRDVGVVPGDIFSPQSLGPNSLLKDGAWPILSHSDVLAMLGMTADVPKGDQTPINKVHAALQESSLTIDNLVQALQMSPVDVQQQLTMLDIDGLLGRAATGEYFVQQR